MKCFSDEWIELYKINRFCTTHGSYLVSRNLSELKVVSSGRNCSFPLTQFITAGQRSQILVVLVPGLAVYGPNSGQK